MSVVSRSLRYYWRHHLGFALSVALACAVLVSGLMVGDSLHEGLRVRTAQRIGPLDHLLSTEGRWFNDDFVERLSQETPSTIAPGFSMSASAKSEEGQVVGTRLLAVDNRMWSMGEQTLTLAPGEVILNGPLAEALDVSVGDSVIVRFERPDALPAQSALRSEAALTSIRLKVSDVRAGEWPFDMDLHSSGSTPFNAFVSLDELEARLGWRPLNVVLFDGEFELETIDAAIDRAWRHSDAQLNLVEGPGWIELQSPRVLLEPAVVAAATAVDPDSTMIASWFVDEARGPDSEAAYFFVSAVEGGASSLSHGLGPKDIALSFGLADRLDLDVGDGVTLRLPILGARKDVIYEEAEFYVRRLFQAGDGGADASLMPPIPGMKDSPSCRDWEIGLPIDLNRITQEDEAFWQNNGGAPKALISLETATALWSSTYGTLTAIRFSSGQSLDDISEGLRSHLQPRQFGFFAEPVRERMTRASSPINDFGQLFFGFNLFLILSALFLVSIFSGFAIERRRSQQGLLVAVGFTPQAVHRIILLEFGIVSFVGCLAGLVGALGLAELLLSGLMGPWQDAVGVLALNVHVSLRTLLQGAGAMWLVAMGAAWLGVRSTLAATAWSNLRGVSLGKNVRSFTGVGLQRWVGPVLLALAVGAALFSDAARGPSAALVYFGCGGLVLVGCLLLVWTWLQTPGTDMPTSLLTVGVAGLRVRPKSSFAVVSVVALGLYMVGGIGGGSLQPRIESTDRHSGTGGFAWMAQTSVPIQADLASAHGLEIHGLASSMVPDQAIGLGLFAGDDASCMNMGSAQTPSLLGVQTEAFDRRDVFQFLEPSAASWRVLLEGPEDATVIPVVGDAATVHWGLHLKVGDELETVDEYGGTLRLQIAAVVDNWIFQGALVADREKLALRFPSRRGDSMFLIDSTSSSDGLVTKIDERLADYGVVLQRPVTVLEGYRRVERTYMLIFGVLGGLGVLLAVVGVVALSYRRSVEAGRDRALLMALGFTREQVRTLGLAEMSALMAAGMFCGVLATVVALLPRLMLMDWTALFRFLFLACTILVVGFVGVGIVSRVTGGRGDVESIHRNQ